MATRSGHVQHPERLPGRPECIEAVHLIPRLPSTLDIHSLSPVRVRVERGPRPRLGHSTRRPREDEQMTAPTAAARAGTGTPSVVIFDVNETLSDMSPLADSFDRVGLGSGAVEPWFASVLRDGFALTSVGVNPGFADLASESLRVRLAALEADDTQQLVDEVMDAFTSLSVHSDVIEGVRALSGRGVRLVTLSNGSTSVAQGLLQRAGVRDAFETLLSVEDAGAWKPHPASYAHALEACRVAAGEAMLVAVHPWDIDGAARAGLRTGWLNRNDSRYPAYFTTPEVAARDLVD
ncbi:MAG: haloacid dehalogenase type II, partial [Terrabacter sp.]